MRRHPTLLPRVRQGLLLACLLPIAALAGRPDVSPAAVAEITARPDAPLLLDVRSPEEFAAGHVAGAVNIPHDQLASRLAEVEAWLERRRNQPIRRAPPPDVRRRVSRPVRTLDRSEVPLPPAH